MVKEINYDTQTRSKMLTGINKLANTVKVTLGPKGRYVALERTGASPLVTNDGASIAKEIELEDPFEAMGTALIKEVASKTNDAAGDGTTTAMLLACQMAQEGIRLVAAGANPIALKRGILGASQIAAAGIRKIAKPIQGTEELKQLAIISAKDELIGSLVAKAIERVGAEGAITVEDSTSWETELDVAEGMQFKRGFLSPQMATNTDELTAELNHPFILVTDRTITNPQELLPLLNSLAEQERPLLIIAESIEGAALGTLIINAQEDRLQAVAVHPPAYGEGRRAQMDDIAVYSGATYLTQEMGLSLNEATLDMLGSAESVQVGLNNTVIIKGKGSEEALADRINSLRALMENMDYDFARKQLEERLARLVSGVAVLSIGGATEAEMQERKLRCQDALNAALSAIEGGIVPGGGVAYLTIKPAIKGYSETLKDDEQKGAAIVLRALDKPTWHIAENAGASGDVVLAELLQRPHGTGYDAARGEYSNMHTSGIIDSAKVTRLALESATSVAAVLLTTEVGIVQKIAEL